MNGAHQDSKMVGDHPGFFKLWYNMNSMVNILLFSEVCKKFHITMNTDIKSIIKVHLEEGKVMRFKEVNLGQYFLVAITSMIVTRLVPNHI